MKSLREAKFAAAQKLVVMTFLRSSSRRNFFQDLIENLELSCPR